MEATVEIGSLENNENAKKISFFSGISKLTAGMLMMLSCLTASTLAFADVDQSSISAMAAPKSGGILNSMGSGLDATIDWFGFNHTRVDGLNNVYIGVGLTNSLIHVYAEAPTRFGHVYVKAGQFFRGSQMVGQLGFRMPYHYKNEKNNDGVYFGAYTGYLDNTSIGSTNERKDRLGAALELSYLRLNKTSLAAASVSIGAVQRSPLGKPDQQNIVPLVMFGLNWGFGSF